MPTSNVATTIRMNDYAKAVLDSAAKYTNQSRSAFMLSVSLEKAEEVIRERSEAMREIATIILNAEESQNFLAALERDFEPSEALLNLKKHYDSFNIVDRT
ncbi:hypothetical protein AGMMS50276_07510 [Synergistales bacterium]|nr:hypothetical protein AGMMS50276_07510 [Synergistales bacterium]